MIAEAIYGYKKGVGSVPENVIENLSERQQRIIRLVKECPFATTGMMADRLNVSVMTIRRDIEKMSRLIRHVGPDKGGHWEIQKE